MPQTRTGPGSYTPGAGTTSEAASGPAYRPTPEGAITRRQRRLTRAAEKVIPGSLRARILVAVVDAGTGGLAEGLIPAATAGRDGKVRKQRSALAARGLIRRTDDRSVWVATDDGVVLAAWLDGGAACSPS
jgi:hypothetical protein